MRKTLRDSAERGRLVSEQAWDAHLANGLTVSKFMRLFLILVLKDRFVYSIHNYIYLIFAFFFLVSNPRSARIGGAICEVVKNMHTRRKKLVLEYAYQEVLCMSSKQGDVSYACQRIMMYGYSRVHTYERVGCILCIICTLVCHFLMLCILCIVCIQPSVHHVSAIRVLC